MVCHMPDIIGGHTQAVLGDHDQDRLPIAERARA